MKKIIFTVLLTLSSMIFQAQSFANYENNQEVNSMVMTSKMLKMLSKVEVNSDPDAQKYMQLLENLDQIKMYSTSNTSMRQQMESDVNKYLQTASLESLMQVNESGRNIKFYSKPGKNETHVSRLFMFMKGDLNGEPSTVILDITGDVDLNQLSRLASELQMPGISALKKLETR